MNRIKTYLLWALCLVSSVALSGQKLGYLNSQQLIQQIPQVKEANAELEVLQQQFEKEGQDKVAGLQTKYAALQRKQEQGEISPKQLEVESQALEQERLKIAQFQQESQQKLAEKSETLLKPIRDRINTAIQEVAAEQGFIYIFDASTGIILYADEASDVTELVKSKLGITN